MDWKEFVSTAIELMGYKEWSVDVDDAARRGTIFIHDHATLESENLPMLVAGLNHLFQLIAKKHNQSPVFFDINNYRHEREQLIVELARGAARKVLVTKQNVSLPAMNSYERRLVHLALATHPDVVTESSGDGRGRYVVVRLIGEEGSTPAAQRKVDLPVGQAEETRRDAGENLVENPYSLPRQDDGV